MSAPSLSRVRIGNQGPAVLAVALNLVFQAAGAGQYLSTQAAVNGGITSTAGDPCIEDFDLDGAPDLALRDGSRVLLFRNPGNAVGAQILVPSVVILPATLPGGLSAMALTAGRIDGDQNPDLVVVAGIPGGGVQLSAWCLRGDGAGAFQPPVYLMPVAGAQPWIYSLDLDGDTRRDLAFVASAGVPPVFTVSAHLNRFPAWITVSSQVSAAISSAGAADLDGNGSEDLFWTEPGPAPAPSSWRLRILWGTPSGVIQLPQNLPLSSGWSSILAAGDFDGDGPADIILSSPGSPGPGIAFGTLNGPPAGPVPFAGLFLPAPWILASVTACDVDQNGIPDALLLGTSSQITGTTGAGSSIHLLRGRGGRIFDLAPRLQWTSPPGTAAVYRPSAADLDGDGDQDVLALNAAPPGITILRNRAFTGPPCAGSNCAPAFPIGTAFPGNGAFALGLAGAAAGRPAGIFVSTATVAGAACAPALGLAPGSLILPAGTIGLVTTDLGGSASLLLPIPSVPALAGATFFAQWAIDDPAGGFAAAGRTYALTAARTIMVW